MIYGHFKPTPTQTFSGAPSYRRGEGWHCAGPGYTVRVQDARADVYADRHRIVVLLGDAYTKSDGQTVTAQSLSALYSVNANATGLLGGHYGLIVLDAERGQALLCSDRFATQSLCHAEQDGSLHFSDRADELGDRLGRAVDEQALFDYLYFHAIAAPRTAFRDVSRLELGCTAHFSAAGLKVASHWWPMFVETEDRPFAELKAEFLALIESAVKRESASRSTGCFLSGGTDSSTVAGMLTRVSGKPAKSFSIGFDAAGYDEMEYARIAARRFGTEHHEHYLTREELQRNIPLVAASYDQPFGNSSAGAAYQCALIAKAQGVEKLLAGDGGDELFGGNTRYAKQRVFEAYYKLPAPFRALVVQPVLAIPGVSKLPLFSKAASYVEQARVPMPDRMNMYNLIMRLGITEILEPEFLAHVDTDAPARQQRLTYAQTRGAALVNRMLAFDWKYTLADNDLPKVCGTVHLAGLEVGFPFLSDELLDFSLRLAPELKLKGLKLRYFFKEALRDFLPDEIITKKKHGFGLPFGNWVIEHAGLRGLAFDSLNDLRQRGIVRAQFLDDLRDRLLPQHPGYYGEMVWILMMMEQWFAARAKAV